MRAIIDILPRPEVSPLLVTGRDDDVGPYAGMGYSFLVDASGATHLVNIYRDIKVREGSIQHLPRVARR